MADEIFDSKGEGHPHGSLSSRPEREARSGETPAFEDASAEGMSPSPEAEQKRAEPFALESPQPAPTPEAKPAKEKKPLEEASQSPFVITVGQVYDGPFDLLLDLIRRQNIDIYDIPIARITAQFLEYTRHLQQTDVDAAGEFIYTASLLIHIKSKMLLPRDPSSADSGADEDPRRELVERLLEHERYKSAAQMLMQKQQVEDATVSHSGMKGFLADEGIGSTEDVNDITADASDLVRVIVALLQRSHEKSFHAIDEETVTVAEMINVIKRRLVSADKPVSLLKLLKGANERKVICAFLAMLELVRLQAIVLRQPEQEGDILIKKSAGFEQVMSETAQVRDDWS